MVIVAAVDRSDRTTAVIDEAQTLAKAVDDTIHVVYVLTRSEFVKLERTSVDETGTALEIGRVREVAANIAAEAITEIDTSYKTVGLMGEPAERIVEYADEVDARYIVVSSRKRSPTGKVVFGSTSQSILLNASSPVVSIIDQDS